VRNEISQIKVFYFANRFPEARIIAIEPEESNFEILKNNIAPYGNIISICGALWHETARINLLDPGTGKWGFMTQELNSVEDRYGDIVHETQGMTINTIIEQYQIDHVDILKIDIEGAER
jgi:FkbM family methyltransferase